MAVVAVGYDCLALSLEFLKVVYHQASEEGRAVLQRRLVDYHLGAFGLYTLHDALYAALAEVVGVRLHGQAIHSYYAFPLLLCVVVAAVVVVIVVGFLQHLVGYEVFACAVALHYGSNQLFRHVVVVGEELLRVLRQAVAAIAEGGVVVVVAYSRVKAYAFYYVLSVKPFQFGVGVQFVEVGYAKSEVSVGEQFYRFRFGGTHIKSRDILGDGTFLQQRCKLSGRFGEERFVVVVAHDDAAGV